MSDEHDLPAATPAGSTFAADWLSLREPVDHRSRAEEVLPPLIDAWRTHGWRRIVDLGAGTGSNTRYLAPRLPTPQAWTLVDHDAALLERAFAPNADVTLSRTVGDLGREGIAALDHADLVVGAALLDLVSEGWLRRIVEACATGERGAFFTTIYDGTVAWAHDDAGTTEIEDLEIRDLVNAHQRRDKGLGGALGPDAGPAARELFNERGYRTWLVPAPWILEARDRALTNLLIQGWAEAACDQSPDDERAVRAWAEDRKRRVATGRSTVVVGHLDLLALPPDPVP